MNRYPESELDFTDLLYRSVRLHYLTLKHTVFCILMITLVKYLSAISFVFVSSLYGRIVVYVIAGLIVSYLLAGTLLAAQRAFNDRPESIFDALKTIWHRLIPIYTTFLAYVVGSVAVYFLAKFAMIGLMKVLHESSALHDASLMLTTVLMLVYVAMFFFSFPLSIIDDKPIHKAFYESALLGERNKFGILVLFVIMGLTILLLVPGMIHEYFLSLYHLDAVFDFVVLCVAVPIYINLLLLLINDSKCQIK